MSDIQSDGILPYVVLMGVDGKSGQLMVKLHSGDKPPSALAQIIKPYAASLLQKGLPITTRTFTMEQLLREARPDATIPTNYVEEVDLCVVKRGSKSHKVLVIRATECGYAYLKEYYKMDGRSLECAYTVLDTYNVKLKTDIPEYVQDVLLKLGLLFKRIK